MTLHSADALENEIVNQFFDALEANPEKEEAYLYAKKWAVEGSSRFHDPVDLSLPKTELYVVLEALELAAKVNLIDGFASIGGSMAGLAQRLREDLKISW